MYSHYDNEMRIAYYDNEFGEPLEEIGDIIKRDFDACIARLLKAIGREE